MNGNGLHAPEKFYRTTLDQQDQKNGGIF